jgi:hypothetical protein
LFSNFIQQSQFNWPKMVKRPAFEDGDQDLVGDGFGYTDLSV